MGRSFFSMGFRSDPFMGVPGVPGPISGPLYVDLTADEIEARNYKPLFDLKLSKGYTTVYPYVVKIKGNSGEYLVYGDKSIQFTDYGTGHVSAPFYAK